MKKKFYVSICHNRDDVARRKIVTADGPTEACSIVVQQVIDTAGLGAFFVPAITQFIMVSEQGFPEQNAKWLPPKTANEALALLPVILENIGIPDYEAKLKGEVLPGLQQCFEDGLLNEISKYSPQMLILDEPHVAWLTQRFSRLEPGCLLQRYLS